MKKNSKPWLSHDPRSVVFSAALGRLSDRLAHGFFTREGGVSLPPVASLNCGFGASSDDPARIKQNRAFVAGTLGAKACNLVSVYQIHSAAVIEVTEPWTREEAPKADALVTRTPGIALGVLSADCSPLLFADEAAGVIGAAHAGWKGAVGGVLESTLAAMEKLGASLNNTVMALGPTISQANYEVGEDFRDQIVRQDGGFVTRHFTEGAASGKLQFDLPGYLLGRAASFGLQSAENLELCTYADPARFFSYRRACHLEEADYGRQISAIMLHP